MAFSRDDFQRIGGGLSGDAPSVFSYTSVGDNLAAQRASGYFNNASSELTKGDFILHNQLTSAALTSAVTGVSVVANITSAGVVTTVAIS